MVKTKIINISKIITWNQESNSLDILLNKEILVENNIIIGIENNFNSYNCNIVDAEQCILTPGFIDSHTHPIFIGNRSNEFKMRLNGSSYEDINNAGGGILSSIKSLRNASFDQLYKYSLNNIKPFINSGTLTLEAKSGYGLSVKDEIKSLKVIKKINDELTIDILPTFLGAHAVPDGYKTEEYVDLICKEMIPQIAEEKLAVFCDVFCEEGYFDLDQTRKILEISKKYGLLPRGHADEFKSFGASELANEIGALSADHLMVIDDKGVQALSNSDTVATLLPGTTFFLNKNKYANGRRLIDNGCSVALASDFNPGTCTIRSLTNIMYLAMQHCGLTLEESFLGVTYNAAKSLKKEHILGLIKPKYNADILFWDIQELDELPYWFDSSYTKINKIMKNGKIL
ncbi:MAG: imidazolonepropionase [Candidatus Marinimicrobia bacterium]|nr:imidazolonepropionase [Candidatus Neomarinimicrobiota bacterium]